MEWRVMATGLKTVLWWEMNMLSVSVMENSEPSVKSIGHLLEPGGPVTSGT